MSRILSSLPSLVYIYVSKIKGGFLFPSKVELNNPSTDVIFVTQVSYGVMRECVASLVKGVMGLSGEAFKVGLHSPRYQIDMQSFVVNVDQPRKILQIAPGHP